AAGCWSPPVPGSPSVECESQLLGAVHPDRIVQTCGAAGFPVCLWQAERHVTVDRPRGNKILVVHPNRLARVRRVVAAGSNEVLPNCPRPLRPDGNSWGACRTPRPDPHPPPKTETPGAPPPHGRASRSDNQPRSHPLDYLVTVGRLHAHLACDPAHRSHSGSARRLRRSARSYRSISIRYHNAWRKW